MQDIELEDLIEAADKVGITQTQAFELLKVLDVPVFAEDGGERVYEH